MKKLLLATAALSMMALQPALAHGPDKAVATVPPAAPYQQVSKLVPLPDFVPGLGELYVDPATLPAGPFLAYDHDGKLISTVYMVPIADLNPDTSFDDLQVPGRLVDHVDIYYNAGHPGVSVPHAHIVLWHVPADQEQRVAE